MSRAGLPGLDEWFRHKGRMVCRRRQARPVTCGGALIVRRVMAHGRGRHELFVGILTVLQEKSCVGTIKIDIKSQSVMKVSACGKIVLFTRANLY